MEPLMECRRLLCSTRIFSHYKGRIPCPLKLASQRPWEGAATEHSWMAPWQDECGLLSFRASHPLPAGRQSQLYSTMLSAFICEFLPVWLTHEALEDQDTFCLHSQYPHSRDLTIFVDWIKERRISQAMLTLVWSDFNPVKLNSFVFCLFLAPRCEITWASGSSHFTSHIFSLQMAAGQTTIPFAFLFHRTYNSVVPAWLSGLSPALDSPCICSPLVSETGR